VKAVYHTDIGYRRRENEDSYLVTDTLFAVADGVGGYRGGKEASSKSLAILSNLLTDKTPGKEELLCAIEEINKAIYDAQEDEDGFQGMSTTLSLLWTAADGMLVGHIGDSRVYLLREGELIQVTQDHSLVAELEKDGYITAEEAESYPHKNIITRAIGMQRSVFPDVFFIPACPGDKWLVCSDGLHNMVKRDDIHAILVSLDTVTAAETLLKKALENGGTDNITLVLIDSAEDD